MGGSEHDGGSSVLTCKHPSARASPRALPYDWGFRCPHEGARAHQEEDQRDRRRSSTSTRSSRRSGSSRPPGASSSQPSSATRRLRARRAGPRGVLGRARRSGWTGPAPGTRSWSGRLPFVKWFVGGTLNASVNCLDRHVAGGRRRQGRVPLGGGAGRYADDHLPRAPRRGLPARQRAPVARGAQGRSREHLSRDGAGAADRDARVRADRRAAFGGVRRVQRRLAP